MTPTTNLAETVTIGGDVTVGRLGYGAMRLTGDQDWGDYPDHDGGIDLLSARSINVHVDLLAQILAVAVDHGHLPSNPAVGKGRRMKVSKPRPVHLDSAEQIAILLEAAGPASSIAARP
jgi:hypothetical protein